MPTTLRTETADGVRSLVLCRPAEYNTITPTLRDDLAAAIDEADADPAVHVILLRAEGRAFSAGYGLDWATAAQAREAAPTRRVWDSVADGRLVWPASESLWPAVAFVVLGVAVCIPLGVALSLVRKR